MSQLKSYIRSQIESPVINLVGKYDGEAISHRTADSLLNELDSIIRCYVGNTSYLYDIAVDVCNDIISETLKTDDNEPSFVESCLLDYIKVHINI